MPFSGASNVVHVSTQGTRDGDGLSWSTAVNSLHNALLKLPSGHGLILIAPGAYASTSVLINAPKIKIQGAGPGTLLQGSAAVSYVIRIAANDAEIADLSAEGPNAILCDTSTAIENLRLSRCYFKGENAVRAYKCKGLALDECMIEGTKTAVEIGLQEDASVALYSCLASNCDLRASNPASSDSQAVVVNGGQLTAMNCSIGNLAPTAGTGRHAGIQVSNGGQIVLTNCELTVQKGGAATVHIGVDVIGTTARMKLTGCSVLAQGGIGPQSISPSRSGNTARLQEDACLISPAWN